MRASWLLAVLLLAAPLALAQSHDHEGGEGTAFIVHDGPADGRAVVGGATHFGFALVDHDGRPVAHKDASFRVEQEGVVVFESADTHEYDGLFSFDVLFAREGAYRVTAMSDGFTTHVFDGRAVLPANETTARIVWDGGVDAGLLAGTLAVVDADGDLLPHSDLLVEARDALDGRLVARWHGHVHDAPVAFKQALPPGRHVLEITAYNAFPTGTRPDFRALVERVDVLVPPAPGAAAPAEYAPPELLRPVGGSVAAGGLTLTVTYDPQPQVGVGQMARLAALVTNETGVPLQHVDFAYTLVGPNGIVFESSTLHEYDGVFEHQFAPHAPGLYRGELVATRGDETLALAHEFQVVPPALPLAAGVGVVTASGLDDVKAGEPVTAGFRVAGPQGGIAHSEVDVTVSKPGEPALYRFKLHTHGSGDTAATLLFPDAGEWVVRVDALPTLPEPVAFVGPDGPGKPVAFTVTVDPGDVLEETLVPADVAAGAADVPGPGVGAVVLVALLTGYLRSTRARRG